MMAKKPPKNDDPDDFEPDEFSDQLADAFKDDDAEFERDTEEDERREFQSSTDRELAWMESVFDPQMPPAVWDDDSNPERSILDEGLPEIAAEDMATTDLDDEFEI